MPGQPLAPAAARALVVGAAAQLVGQALQDAQGRDLRAADGSVTLWVIAHVVALVGVVALTVGADRLASPLEGRLATVGRAVVLLGAAAAALTLLYDIVLGAAALTGTEPAAPQGTGRDVLRALDTLDFALVVGLVLVVVAWWADDRSRLLAGCSALLGLAVPALPGIETLAAGCVLLGLVLLVTFERREVGPRLGRVAPLLTVGAYAAAGLLSIPRAALGVVVVVLVLRVTHGTARTVGTPPTG